MCQLSTIPVIAVIPPALPTTYHQERHIQGVSVVYKWRSMSHRVGDGSVLIDEEIYHRTFSSFEILVSESACLQNIRYMTRGRVSEWKQLSSSGMNLSGKQGLELKTDSRESPLKLKVLLSKIFGLLRSSIFNISGIDSFEILFPICQGFTQTRFHVSQLLHYPMPRWSICRGLSAG